MHKTLVSVDLVKAALRAESMKNIPVQQLQRDAKNYARFLELTKRYGGPMAPTRDIDQMWHLHMLHPVAYFEDCVRLFGRILDHDGGVGAVAEERPLLGRVFERTAMLWQKEFGEPYATVVGESAESCWHDCSGRCWHACSSKRIESTSFAAAE